MNASPRAKVTLASSFDVRSLAMALAADVRQQAGLPPLSGDEAEAMVEEIAVSLDAQSKRDAEVVANRIAQSLPPGMRVVSMSASREGMRLGSRTTLELDDLTKIAEVKFPDGQWPFRDFKVSRSNGVLLIHGQGPTTTGDATMALELELEAPARSHNAAEAHGNRLTWRGSQFVVRLELPAS